MTSNQTSDGYIAAILSDYEKVVARIILFCVTELSIPLGVKRLIDVLKGNRNSFALNNELNRLNTFSALTSFTRDQISDILDILVEKGLLEVESASNAEEDTPVFRITSKGHHVLSSAGLGAPELLHVLLDQDVPGIHEDDQDLYYKLKQVRRQLAEEEDLPAFMVCSNQVLFGLCQKKPIDIENFTDIHGVDDDFIQQYGKSFLYVIRQYQTR